MSGILAARSAASFVDKAPSPIGAAGRGDRLRSRPLAPVRPIAPGGLARSSGRCAAESDEGPVRNRISLDPSLTSQPLSRGPPVGDQADDDSSGAEGDRSGSPGPVVRRSSVIELGGSRLEVVGASSFEQDEAWWTRRVAEAEAQEAHAMDVRGLLVRAVADEDYAAAARHRDELDSLEAACPLAALLAERDAAAAAGDWEGAARARDDALAGLEGWWAGTAADDGENGEATDPCGHLLRIERRRGRWVGFAHSAGDVAEAAGAGPGGLAGACPRGARERAEQARAQRTVLEVLGTPLLEVHVALEDEAGTLSRRRVAASLLVDPSLALNNEDEDEQEGNDFSLDREERDVESLVDATIAAVVEKKEVVVVEREEMVEEGSSRSAEAVRVPAMLELAGRRHLVIEVSSSAWEEALDGLGRRAVEVDEEVNTDAIVERLAARREPEDVANVSAPSTSSSAAPIRTVYRWLGGLQASDSPIDHPLDGLWLGTFGPHGPELLSLGRRVGPQGEETVVATKLTGDPSVPAGCVSFEAPLLDGAGRCLSLPSSGGGYPEGLGVKRRWAGRGRVGRQAAGGREGAPSERGWVRGELVQLEGGPSPATDLAEGASLGFVWELPPEDGRPSELDRGEANPETVPAAAASAIASRRFLILLHRVRLGTEGEG